MLKGITILRHGLLLALGLFILACGGEQQNTETETSESTEEVNTDSTAEKTESETEETPEEMPVETQSSTFMHWNGSSLEMVYAEIDPSTSKIVNLQYQAAANAEKVALKITDQSEERCTVLNPKTGKDFEVDTYWTMAGSFYYADGSNKEFIPSVEFANGDEKIIMGAMPMLGYIIYQKGGKSELWLKNPDQNCKEGERNGNVSFMCGFNNPQGQNVRLMIDQVGKNVTIWVNEEMKEFIGK